WRSAVIYQVYIRSFADGDGDGVGVVATGLTRPNTPDIPGIETADDYSVVSVDPEDPYRWSPRPPWPPTASSSAGSRSMSP
ncbi:hypothetical protein, partial [Streptomyces prunicolor]|uniref:hypothetical protein n=1 Tax=Streptomyces prunicolor TaxID=67348 RepID=UPI0033C46E34